MVQAFECFSTGTPNQMYAVCTQWSVGVGSETRDFAVGI